MGRAPLAVGWRDGRADRGHARRRGRIAGVGPIERSDYEWALESELRAAVGAGRMRALFVIERVDGIDPAALWANFKLFFDVARRHRATWERTAIVTDVAWMASVTRAFLGVIPGAGRPICTEGSGSGRRLA
jgi:hypothetical protein